MCVKHLLRTLSYLPCPELLDSAEGPTSRFQTLNGNQGLLQRPLVLTLSAECSKSWCSEFLFLKCGSIGTISRASGVIFRAVRVSGPRTGVGVSACFPPFGRCSVSGDGRQLEQPRSSLPSPAAWQGLAGRIIES